MENINELNANIQALLNEESARRRKIEAADIEISKAKAALAEARKQKRLAKNNRDIDYKQYAENMAELLEQLPIGQRLTPTQLAHLYNVAYPTFRNVGVLHIHSLYNGQNGYKINGLEETENGLYYRSREEVRVCRW